MIQSDLTEQIRNEIFSEPRLEHCVDAAGTKQMKKYLGNGRLGKGFAVLSDFALYIKGKCYLSRRGERPIQRKVDYRLDLPVIESVKLVAIKPFWCVFLFFFFLVLSPVPLLLDKLTGYGSSTSLTPWLDALACLIISLIFLLGYFIGRKELMQVKFRGGALAIPSKVLPQQEMLHLMRTLRFVLEQQRPGARTAPQPSHHNPQS